MLVLPVLLVAPGVGAQQVGVSAELLTNHKDSANAQSSTVNGRQDVGGANGHVVATRFVTGSNPAGYQIESIAPWFFSASTGAQPVLQIYSAEIVRMKVWVHAGALSGPQSLLHTFRFAAGLGNGLRTFEAPATGKHAGRPGHTQAQHVLLDRALRHGYGMGGLPDSSPTNSSRDAASETGWTFHGRTSTDSMGVAITRALRSLPQASFAHPRFTIRGTPHSASHPDHGAASTSSPLDGDTYKAGEHIEVVFIFDKPVKYASGVAAIYAWRRRHRRNGQLP